MLIGKNDGHFYISKYIYGHICAFFMIQRVVQDSVHDFISYLVSSNINLKLFKISKNVRFPTYT